MTPAQVGLSLAAGLLLWGFYFALGFRAFAHGAQANGFGLLLTVGLPLAAYALYRLGLPFLGEWLPPGLVYGVGSPSRLGPWLLLPALALLAATALIARHALRHGDRQLRRWYDQNQGRKVIT
jgi:hypothetical protein